MGDLPRPVTVTDKYLAAILARLAQLEDKLTAPPAPPPAEEIALREPFSLLTALPDDFPGRDRLQEVGILYLETVPRRGDVLTAVPGIGAKTANAILTYLKQHGAAN